MVPQGLTLFCNQRRLCICTRLEYRFSGYDSVEALACSHFRARSLWLLKYTWQSPWHLHKVFMKSFRSKFFVDDNSSDARAYKLTHDRKISKVEFKTIQIVWNTPRECNTDGADRNQLMNYHVEKPLFFRYAFVRWLTYNDSWASSTWSL